MTQQEFKQKYAGDKSFQDEVDKNPMAAMGKYEVELSDKDLEEIAGGNGWLQWIRSWYISDRTNKSLSEHGIK